MDGCCCRVTVATYDQIITCGHSTRPHPPLALLHRRRRPRPLPSCRKPGRPAAARPAAPGDASGRAGDASGRPAAAPTTRHVDVMCADRCPRAFRFVLSRSRPLHANIGGLVAIEY